MEKDQQKSVQWYSYQDDYSGAGDKVGIECWFRNKILKCWNAKSEKETSRQNTQENPEDRFLTRFYTSTPE